MLKDETDLLHLADDPDDEGEYEEDDEFDEDEEDEEPADEDEEEWQVRGRPPLPRSKRGGACSPVPVPS